MHETDGRSFFVHPSAVYGSHRAMFHQGWLPNCTKEYQMLGTPSQYQNGLSLLKEWHPLLMKCFKTILRCMRLIGGALDRICLSAIGPNEPFSTKVGSQIAPKMPHFGYPLSTENAYIMGCWCWTARRYINCLWSASKPSLCALSRLYELHCALFRHLWVTPSYVPRRLTLKLLTKCKFGVSSHSQSGKLGAKLWGETSIAYELFQNLP